MRKWEQKQRMTNKTRRKESKWLREEIIIDLENKITHSVRQLTWEGAPWNKGNT